MKANFLLLTCCLFLLFACKEKETITASDLVGKWNVIETEQLFEDSIYSTPPQIGANIIFIYYVENGIEFFRDHTFNMRIMGQDGSFSTYDILPLSDLKWELDEDLITLRYGYGDDISNHQEYLFQFTLNNNQLTIERNEIKYHLVRE